MWLIVGITGITCSGKSALTKSIHDYYSGPTEHKCSHRIGKIHIIKQDDYFFKRDSPNHIHIPSMDNYINREVITAIDMNRMCKDIDDILMEKATSVDMDVTSTIDILIIDGFLIFNNQRIRELCMVKFDMHIRQSLCEQRRKLRVYNPPNPPGYFQEFILPYYEKHWQEYSNLEGLIRLDGEHSAESLLKEAIKYIELYLDV